MLDLAIDRPDQTLADEKPDWFDDSKVLSGPPPDPRFINRHDRIHGINFSDCRATASFTAWWLSQIDQFLQAGVDRFRCLRPAAVPPAIWRKLIAEIQAARPATAFYAWTPGLSWAEIDRLQSIGFAGGFSSVAWWDGQAPWLAEERELLNRVGPAIAFPVPPDGEHAAPARLFPRHPGARHIALRQALRLAAATGDGLLVPAGFEGGNTPWSQSSSSPFDLRKDVSEANAIVERMASLNLRSLRRLDESNGRVTAWLRCNSEPSSSTEGVVLLVNRDLEASAPVPISLTPLPASAGGVLSADGSNIADRSVLEPGEVRLVGVRPTLPVLQRPVKKLSVSEALRAPRVTIEKVSPTADGGRFPVKQVIGRTIHIEADIFADGHDQLAAEVLWRPADERQWRVAAMHHVVNDRWRATIAPTRVGRHVFTVAAWWDVFGSLCHDIEKKRAAGVETSVEVQEARILLDAALARCRGTAARDVLQNVLAAIDDPNNELHVASLLRDETRAAMAQADERRFLAQLPETFPIDVERPQAGFASWYELFPRSITDDPKRHGTFADVIGRLPAIRAMGFDVLYLPPIHPIGLTNRKGRNNRPEAEPGDVGSPYAIGAAEGGHDAIHPQLGTPEDFRRLVAEAAKHGIELALDFAIQCSLDHPWLKQHPGWFQHRPDGSIRYAENPPKKYEDIVNVDFYAPDALPDLWLALRDVVLHWVGEGVRLFRVDNPHTKPFPFWEWLIADVRGRHPDVVFLSEAFTRPKVMYRLAKIGFSQSYTYFTWRNTKKELTDYLSELSATEVKDYFRPHFFVNTPDINPHFLQTSGRPGFLIRAALAATLSGLWGVYSGFELCEAAPLPGREEYLDSEKYEIRVRDYEAPGNIIAEITALNRLRRHHPALQTHLGVRFYNAFNDAVLFYAKGDPANGELILVAINLDPHHAQEATVEIPLWEWGIGDAGSVAVEDLLRGHRFVWTGKLQQLRLDPSDLPYAVWRIAPLTGGGL